MVLLRVSFTASSRLLTLTIIRVGGGPQFFFLNRVPTTTCYAPGAPKSRPFIGLVFQTRNLAFGTRPAAQQRNKEDATGSAATVIQLTT